MSDEVFEFNITATLTVGSVTPHMLDAQAAGTVVIYHDPNDLTARVLALDPPSFFESLRTMTTDELSRRGLRQWTDEPDGTPPLLLIPAKWYNAIPEGYELESINGEKTKFTRGVTDDDSRFGYLAYGIRGTHARV